MQKLSQLSYRPPWFFRNSHAATIGSFLLKTSSLQYNSVIQLETPDHDTLFADRLDQGNNKAVVILHGLEGDSQRPYVKCAANVAVKRGFDAVALNFRSCNGVMNEQARFYHSGDTEDLQLLITHLFEVYNYESIVLMGFSLGGNVMFKYLGEKGSGIDRRILGGMGVSVPVDLATSAKKIERFSNRLYQNRFLKSLKNKIRQKRERFPDVVDWNRGLAANTIREFDDAVTAPLHGFRGVHDYYKRASSFPLLKNIDVPGVLLNAQNDSFLSSACFPTEGLSPKVHTLYPKNGGHVGFSFWPVTEPNFAERVWDLFLEELKIPEVEKI